MKSTHALCSMPLRMHSVCVWIAISWGIILTVTATSFGGETEDVLLITLDGLRWQELFGGADQRLINKDAGGVPEPDIVRAEYWRSDAKERHLHH